MPVCRGRSAYVVVLLLLVSCQSVPEAPRVTRSGDRIDAPIWFEAAEAGDAAMLAALLDAGIDPRIERQGYTALHVVAAAGYTDAARVLVAAGVNVNLGPDEAEARIADIAGAGNPRLLQMMTGADPDPEAVARATALRTPLNLAVENGHRDVAALLIGAGADVNAGGEWYSPLCSAILSGDRKLVELLLEHGARVNAAVRIQDRSVFAGFRYATPLEVARLIERDDLVALLQAYGGRD